MNDINLIALEEVASTNEYLKKIIDKNTPEGTIVITNKQTKGKGQQSNKWESEEGKNLTFSLLLKPFIMAEQIFMISKVVSLGIIDALLSELGIKFKIKWPNDIYYENKKLAGILIENQMSGERVNHSIIGIGININQEKFLSDAPNPISLKNIIKKNLELNKMLNKIIDHIAIWYEILRYEQLEKINLAYWQSLYRNEGYHHFMSQKGKIKAKIIEVKNDGKLILETSEKKRMGFYLREISFL